MNYSVLLSTEAENNREHTFRYYLEKSPQGAYNWFDAFEQAIQRLKKDPARFSVAKENTDYAVKLQQINFGTRPSYPTHRLIYYVEGQTIFVVTLQHLHQQDWSGEIKT